MGANVDLKQGVVAGVAGTAAMTVLMLMAPAMGMPPMDIGELLGSMMGGSTALGWAAHALIGVVLAETYVAVFASRLPGSAPVRGMIYGLLPWLVAQTMVMPMMGAGFFSGSALAAGGSLMGHLVYGGVLGAVYGAGTGHVPARGASAVA